jgi:primosomal protein N' (replication factor Y)
VTVARVAVEVAPAHLDRPFDYTVPDGLALRVGQRVRVPFAGRARPGWVVGLAEASDADGLLEVSAAEGPWSWFDEDDLALYRWVADRYASTLAAVLRHAIPGRVAAVDEEAATWGPPPVWQPAARPPCPQRAWRPYGASALLKAAGSGSGAFWWRVLPGDDRPAMAADLVARCLAGGRSALVLSADPHSALAAMALATAGALGADLRAERERDRYRAALRCRTGHARVAVGGRAAVFAPLRELGLVLIEDEANPAYKERRTPRHSAREVALARARKAEAAAVLLGDLPSAALWRLMDAGHVRRVAADRATERERAPRVDVVDLGDPRPGARRARLSELASRAVSDAVRAGGAAIVLAARRGDGTALACVRCGRRRPCPVCDGALRAGSRSAGDGWACTTCVWHGATFACPRCGDTRTGPLAAGAGRLASELQRSHPEAEVVAMEGFDAPGPQRRPAIAVMTRGSVVGSPAWLGGEQAAVVVVPDADALLGRPSLEAGEDALRLWLAAGHVTRHVVLQTREPGNAAVQALVRWDPEGFWRREAERRAELRWPPHAALLRIAAPAAEAAEIAASLRGAVPESDEVLGPDPDGAVLVKSSQLRGTLGALTPLRQDWGKRSLRVRVDVDPVP